MISISAERIKKAFPFCSSDNEHRFYLRGVCIEPHESGTGAWVISTNGHVLLAQHDKTAKLPADMKSVIFNVADKGFRSAVVKVARPRKSGRVEVSDLKILTVLEDRIGSEAVLVYTAASPALIEAPYPDWRQILPSVSKLKPGLGRAFNPHYLWLLDSLSLNKHNAVKFFNNGDPKSAVVAFSYGDEHAFALIMPLAADGETVIPRVYPRKLKKVQKADPAQKPKPRKLRKQTKR